MTFYFPCRTEDLTLNAHDQALRFNVLGVSRSGVGGWGGGGLRDRARGYQPGGMHASQGTFSS